MWFADAKEARPKIAPQMLLRTPTWLLSIALACWMLQMLLVMLDLVPSVRIVLYRVAPCASLLFVLAVLPRVTVATRRVLVAIGLSIGCFLVTSFLPSTIPVSHPIVLSTYIFWFCLDMTIPLLMLPRNMIQRITLVRYAINALIVMAVLEVVFNGFIPHLYTTWNTTSISRLAQFRLDVSLAVGWMTWRLFSQFVGIRRSVRLLLALTMLLFIERDVILVHASLTIPSMALRGALYNPFLLYTVWTVTALMLTLRIETTSWHTESGNTRDAGETLHGSLIRSILITVLLFLVSNGQLSQIHNINLIVAIIIREILSRYERESFIKKQKILQLSLNEKSAEIAQLHHNRMRWIDTAAHDLGHALVTQQATVDQAVFDLEKRLSSQELDSLQTNLERGIRYQSQVLEELREVAQMEAGQAITLSWSMVDLCQVVGRISQQFQAQIESQAVTLIIMCPTSPVMVRGDTRRLQRVLQNIMVNALRAIRDNTHAHITIELTTTSRSVTLTIVDDGCGIPLTELARLREHNYQSFTGVGLHFCAHILAQHGGTMEITSQVGEGTTVALTIPVAEDGV